MVAWRDFAEAEPEFAARTRERFERSGVAFVGSIRRDGSPRVTAVECYFVDGELCLQMLWRSKKALDLLRDPRCVLNTTVHARDDSGGEYKVRGRAVDVHDPAFRELVCREIERITNWRPEEPRFHVFTIDIDDVTEISYDTGEQVVRSWTADGAGGGKPSAG